MKMQPIPEIGKQYYFYDDGKITHSRQYIAKVVRIVSVEESKKVEFPTFQNEYTDFDSSTTFFENETPIGTKCLYDIWQEEIESHINTENFKVIIVGASNEVGDPWLFARETDCFIECEIPKYDKHNIWFVRDVEGGWFSLDIQSGWQGGKLDVSNELTQMLEEAYKDMK